VDDILAQTSFGRELARRMWEEGFAEGQAESRAHAMAILLRIRYGALDDLDELARKLAAADYEQHLTWVNDGVPVEQLRAAGPGECRH
jgi:hypothetical protein